MSNSDSITPKFSIIIPTYTRHDKLAECLVSIRKYTNAESCEVIVSANGADRALLDVYHEFLCQWQGASKLLWSDEPLGFSKACNAGIRASKAEYIILLNDDVILLGQPMNLWLDQLSEPFADPKMGITGTLKQFCPSAQREFLLFFCVMIRKKMMDEIGVLDEIFGVGAGEDCDMSCRAVDRGWKIQAVPDEPPTYADRGDSSLPSHQQGQWVTTSPIYHLGGATVGKLEGFQEVFHRNSEILKRRYGVNIERAKTIEGWMADSELEWLARQAKKSSVFVEIGSWCGRSSRAIADNLPADAILVCVDTFCGSSGEPDAHKTAKEREGDAVYMKFMANLYDHVRLGRVMPLRMESANAAAWLKSQGVVADTIFIDGDHSAEGVKRDIEAWQPLLKEGGTLCGHDYYLPEQNPLAWIGVRKCVDELFPEAIQAPDTTIWTVKDMGAWERLQQLPVTESYQGYGGFFGA